MHVLSVDVKKWQHTLYCNIVAAKNTHLLVLLALCIYKCIMQNNLSDYCAVVRSLLRYSIEQYTVKEKKQIPPGTHFLTWDPMYDRFHWYTLEAYFRGASDIYLKKDTAKRSVKRSLQAKLIHCVMPSVMVVFITE